MQDQKINNETVNQEQPLTLVGNLIRVTSSQIAYMRNIFPSQCFEECKRLWAVAWNCELMLGSNFCQITLRDINFKKSCPRPKNRKLSQTGSMMACLMRKHKLTAPCWIKNARVFVSQSVQIKQRPPEHDCFDNLFGFKKWDNAKQNLTIT